MNSTDFHVVGGPVEIEEYAWICSRSIVLPGVRIGKGAVVASGAIVTNDVEPYAIVFGSPARFYKYRECKEKEKSLNESLYWENKPIIAKDILSRI